MSDISLTHKIRLDVTDEQDKYFRKSCGAVRFSYNCGLKIDRDLNAAINLKSLVPQSLREFKPVELAAVRANAETGTTV